MRRRLTMAAVAVVLLALVGAAVLLWWSVTQPAVSARPCDPPPVSPARLEERVRMLALTLSPRSYLDVENLDKVADYLAAELARPGGEVDEQRYLDPGGVERRNIIARYGPDSAERLVVGAHYDAYERFPGADDNASGVAALVELGGLLAQRPPRMRVELVAYPNEEPPFFTTLGMGSAQHAQAAASSTQRVRAMIGLEMVGTFSDEPGSQLFPLRLLRLFYPDRGNYIVVVGKLGQGGLVRRVKAAMRGAGDLPVESINAPRWVPGIDFSDHASYWDRGMEAVMITDTAFYRNPRYHTPLDTPETLDYVKMAKVVQGVFCAVQALTRDGPLER